MTFRKATIALGLAFATLSAPTFAAVIETFDDEVPAGFVTDRYAPDGFSGANLFQGDNRLQVSIDASDGASNRPGGFSGAFYNTQGKKKALDADIRSVSLELYVDSALRDSGLRRAGLWGTGVDGSSAVSSYGIVELANGRFRGWDSAGAGGWVDIGAALVQDGWYQLSMVLNAYSNTLTYSVGGVGSTTLSAYGTARFSEAMIQGYNSTPGETYSFYADNLTTDVPEPAALGLLGLGVLGLALRRRRAA